MVKGKKAPKIQRILFAFYFQVPPVAAICTLLATATWWPPAQPPPRNWLWVQRVWTGHPPLSGSIQVSCPRLEHATSRSPAEIDKCKMWKKKMNNQCSPSHSVSTSLFWFSLFSVAFCRCITHWISDFHVARHGGPAVLAGGQSRTGGAAAGRPNSAR